MDLDRDVIEWIESQADGTVVTVERQGRWRPHYFVDVKRADGAIVPLLVRYPRDPELIADSAFLSHFDIAHESRVLEALQTTDLNVPTYLGFNPAAQAILMGRVEGTNDLSATSEADQPALLRQYFDFLHELHSIPVDQALSETLGLPIPADATELALVKVGLMESDFLRDQPGLQPEPLIDFALWWMHEHIPQHRTEPHWVQGDTGPGQFMIDGGRISAVIDWEISHIGDPMIDLGVMRMRNQLYPLGELNPYIDYYAELDGRPVDKDALCFYTVVSNVVSPLGMAVTIQRPDPAVGSMLPRFGWDVTLRRGLCDALCEAYGIEIDRPALPEPVAPARTDLEHFLVGHLRELCLPAAVEEFDAFNLRGAIGVAETVELTARIGAQLAEDDLDDMAAVLGHRPSDREQGLAELTELVAAEPGPQALDLLWLFSRMECRREHLWQPMMFAQKSQPFERYFPAERTYRGPGTE